MALNIELDAAFMPIYEPGEFPILKQYGIKFHIHVGGTIGRHEGRGHAILTTRRLILVNRETIFRDFRSFSVPYMNTYEEFLEMGLLGRLHIYGKCRPVIFGLFPDDTKFKIWFEMGGSMHF